MWLCCQVRHLFRLVNPEDYDTATRSLWDTCPLYMLGDQRRGADLLHDCETDAQLPLEKLAARRIEGLIRRLEEKCACLEQGEDALSQASSFAPASAASSDSHLSRPRGKVSDCRPAPVPPPIGVVVGIFLNGASESAFRRVTQQMSIGMPLVAGIRSGYRMEELVEIVDPLPPAFKALLKRAAEALQVRKSLVARPRRFHLGHCFHFGMAVPLHVTYCNKRPHRRLLPARRAADS